MKSRTPKVMHTLAGRPMIDHVLMACREAGVTRPIAVLNPAHKQVVEHLEGRCEIVFQSQPLGTGHALAAAREALSEPHVVVINADSPLLRSTTIRRLIQTHLESGAAATVASVVDPGRDDGRIVRSPEGLFIRVVEALDVTPQQRRIQEFNVGLYCFRSADLAATLEQLSPDNAAGELYLTDVLHRVAPVAVVQVPDPEEAMGINDRVQLSKAEACLRQRLLEELMLSGVTIVNPASTFVEAGVRVGVDSVIEPFTMLSGATVVGTRCRIGPYAQLSDTEVGDDCQIESSWLRGCRVGDRSDCGPFSKLRPGTVIAPDVHVGSFAEINRTSIGRGSSVAHFSYLGDATVGQNVNIGAGTITANFDGRAKHPTVIEDGASVAVDTMFVAPVRMGRGARTGAGSVVTKDIPEGALAVGVPASLVTRSTTAVTDTEEQG